MQNSDEWQYVKKKTWILIDNGLKIFGSLEPIFFQCCSVLHHFEKQRQNASRFHQEIDQKISPKITESLSKRGKKISKVCARTRLVTSQINYTISNWRRQGAPIVELPVLSCPLHVPYLSLTINFKL